MVSNEPLKSSYDVVVIGGAIMGSSTAWWLTELDDFNGDVLVVERDRSYEFTSTARTNSCIRQQFSNEINVQISQFGAEFIQNLRRYMGDDRVPDMSIQNYGYLYLADKQDFADHLNEVQVFQRSLGAETEILSADDIAKRYPFYNVDDIILGSINCKDEGYFDGGGVFDWLRRSAKDRGVEYIENEVIGIETDGGSVQSITLTSGQKISCEQVVNATGPRAGITAKMAGLEVPVEPRKRYTWIFTAENPLDQELPLTIDPSGIHMRQDGPKTYLAGGRSLGPDTPPDFNDFDMDHGLWEDRIWPTIASRIPQFEAIKVINEWAGHYEYNTLDQNAILGCHPDLPNFIFQNGFSGHGLQQSPAMGRATAEWLTYGEYRSLDMTPFSYERILNNEPFVEKAVI